MLYIVTGGSGSGKSEFAENLAVGWFQKNHQKADEEDISVECNACKKTSSGILFYIATMHSSDEESLKRIERHRKQRAGKGFTTVECDVRLDRMEAGSEDVILLEDLSNLLANEMYLESGRMKSLQPGQLNAASDSDRQMEEAILSPILQLEKQASCVIIVTNEIFSGDAEYDAETNGYIHMLGILNQRLAEAADGVVEVVCGIPVWHKGK